MSFLGIGDDEGAPGPIGSLRDHLSPKRRQAKAEKKAARERELELLREAARLPGWATLMDRITAEIGEHVGGLLSSYPAGMTANVDGQTLVMDEQTRQAQITHRTGYTAALRWVVKLLREAQVPTKPGGERA